MADRSQRLHEGNNFGVFLRHELLIKLDAHHGAHRFRQDIGRAVMEVRLGHLDIAKHQFLEVEAVGILACHSNSAFGLAGSFVGFDHAHLLKRVAADDQTPE